MPISWFKALFFHAFCSASSRLTLIDFMTVLYPRWRFDNYIQDQEPNFTYHDLKKCETLLIS